MGFLTGTISCSAGRFGLVSEGLGVYGGGGSFKLVPEGIMKRFKSQTNDDIIGLKKYFLIQPEKGIILSYDLNE